MRTRLEAEAEALEKAAQAVGKAVGPTLWPGHYGPAAKAAIEAYTQHLECWRMERSSFETAILKAQEERLNDTLKRSTQPES